MTPAINDLVELASSNPVASTVTGGLIVALVTFLCRKTFRIGEKPDRPSSAKVDFRNAAVNGDSNVNIADSIVINHPIAQEREVKSIQSDRSFVAQRLNEFLQLINVHSLEKITIFQMSQLVGDADPNNLMKYFSGEELPSFAYIENFCHCFSLNDRWFWGDCRSPFSKFEINSTFPSLSYNSILESRPQQIYFLLSDTAEKAVTIAFKFSDFNFQLASYQWHLSLDHVGATGQSQIVSFYHLLCRLYRRSSWSCTDYIVPKSKWNDLINGKIWPGSFSCTALDHTRRLSYWADDLQDIDHRYAPDYKKLYGEWFIRTQAFIKNKLAEEKDSKTE